MSQKAGSRGGGAAKGKKPTKGGGGAADEKRDDAPLQAVVSPAMTCHDRQTHALRDGAVMADMWWPAPLVDNRSSQTPFKTGSSHLPSRSHG